jgi:hypothetical protein
MYYSFGTESYARWLILMVRSLRRVDRKTPILLHFSGNVRCLASAFTGLRGVTVEPPPEPVGGGLSPAAILDARARNLLTVAHECRFEWLMVMDADLLVRKPLGPLYRPMGLYDFAAVIRGAADGRPLPPHLEISAALYVVTKQGLTILEEANRLMHMATCVRGIRRGEWFWDQACLAEAVLTSGLRIRTIPRELYLSSRPFDRRAAVWNANFSGGRKGVAYRAFEVEWARLRGQLNNKGRHRFP